MSRKWLQFVHISDFILSHLLYNTILSSSMVKTLPVTDISIFQLFIQYFWQTNLSTLDKLNAILISCQYKKFILTELLEKLMSCYITLWTSHNFLHIM